MRISEPLALALILLVLAVGMLLRPIPEVFFGDPGLGWHLKLGEIVLEYGGLPEFDPFTAYRSEPRRWVYGQWLSDVVFFSALSLGGFTLLYLFCIQVSLSSVLLASAWRSASLPAVLILVPMVALAASIQWLCRPVLFSFFFFALLLLLLHAERGRFRSFAVGSALFAIWSNFHPAFVLGFLPILAKLWTLRRAPQRLRALLVFCCGGLVGSLLNPQGLEIYAAIFSLGRSSYFQNLNREWLPPTFSASGFYPFFALLIAFLCAVFRTKGSLKDYRVLTAIVLALLSLKSRRFIPFFCLSCAAPLIEYLAEYLKRFSARYSSCSLSTAVSGRTLFGCLALLYIGTSAVAFSPLHRPLEESHVFAAYPRTLVKQVERGVPEDGTELLHPAELGGFLTLTFWPPPISIIDDRNEIHAADWYQELDGFFYAQAGWEQTLASLAPRYVLCLKWNPIAAELGAAGYEVRGEEASSLGTYVLFERVSREKSKD